jgi:hypothetical protein
MIKLLFRTFILFTFALSSVAGISIEHHEEVAETVVHEHHDDHGTHEGEEHCATEFSCEDDCSSADSCCVGNCGCPASYLSKSTIKKIVFNQKYNRDLSWSYSNLYLSQSIEPSLRPPLQS